MTEYHCFGCKAYFEADDSAAPPTRCPHCNHDDIAKVTLMEGPAWIDRIKPSTVTKVFSPIFGFFLGAYIGYYFRPSLAGEQLGIMDVLTRGSGLQAKGQIAIHVAQNSFNNTLYGAIIGAVVGLLGALIYLQTKASKQPATA